MPGTDKDAIHGADVGVCDAANGSGQELRSADGVPPGRQCCDRGGILVPNRGCSRRKPDNVHQGFGNLGAHLSRHGTRRCRHRLDIQSQPKHRPSMASASFASAHTPVMQPPQSLLTTGRAGADANVSARSAASLAKAPRKMANSACSRT